MTPEDRLRRAIEARTSGVEPSADALSHLQEKLMATQQSDNRKRLLIGLGSAAAVLAVVAGVLAVTQDDDEPVTTELTTTTTSAPEFATVDPDQPVFPDPTTSQRFDDPVAAATAFATDLVGFADPTIGSFMAGDARSGEVEVRAFPEGAPTTVLLRQLEDDAWWVLGAETDSIQLATPAARQAITSPQPLTGQAYAFEGTVVVRLHVDGTQEPVAETFVTGRGDGVLGDFEGELAFTAPDGATHGVLVLLSQSAEDGSTVEAQVLRVRL